MGRGDSWWKEKESAREENKNAFNYKIEEVLSDSRRTHFVDIRTKNYIPHKYKQRVVIFIMKEVQNERFNLQP